MRDRATRFVMLSTMLAGLAALELIAGPFFAPRAPQSIPTSKALEDARKMPPLEKPDISVFSEMVERPLFVPSRRPIIASVDPVTAQDVQSAAFDLVGIIVSPHSRVALLRPRTSTKILRAVEGQRVGGWEVREIKATQIILARGNGSEVIKLNDTHRKRNVNKRQVAGQPAKKSSPEGESFPQGPSGVKKAAGVD